MNKLIIVALFIISFVITAQESPVDGAIFPYDTCAPPCWLGLVPGVSTSIDVDSVLAQHPDIIDLETLNKSASRLSNGEFAIDQETGEMLQGGYYFDILTPPLRFSSRASSRIEIENGFVDLVVILATEEHDILMSVVLEKMGVPDQIRIYSTVSDNLFHFAFIYLDSRVRVNFYQLAEQCRTVGLTKRFSLLNALYYSEHSAQELIPSLNREIFQPALTVFNFETERDVPLDVWQSWLDGEVDESCFEAWQKLAPPQIGLPDTAQESPVDGAIFPYDTCAPPCWMGLTPDISTSADVESVLEQYSDIIDPESIDRVVSRQSDGTLAVDAETGEMLKGGYYFDILTPTTQFSSIISSRIEIEDGVVDLMMILTAEEHNIPMSDVLIQMGTPDQVHMQYAENDISVYFIYLDRLMNVNLYQSAENCRTTNLTETFSLQNTLHYSEHSAYKLVRGADYQDILQPALTRFGLKNERDVPLDVWQSWINGEVNESCFEAWQKLAPPQLEIAQDTDDVKMDDPPISLFIGDTCSAPCWFGLTIGESTSQDLENMIHANREEFGNIRYSDVNIYSSEGVLIDGYVDIYRKNQSLDFRFDVLSNTILVSVKNEIIDTIITLAQRKLKIADVLSTYGDPDIATWYFGQIDRLFLIYVDESIVVEFGFVKDESFETYSSSFKVHKIRYFSPSDIEGIFESYLFDFLDESSTRFVPPETLQCWAEEKDTCISSWWDLPEEKDIDLSPWLEITPEVEVTAEPSS